MLLSSSSQPARLPSPPIVIVAVHTSTSTDEQSVLPIPECRTATVPAGRTDDDDDDNTISPVLIRPVVHGHVLDVGFRH